MSPSPSLERNAAELGLKYRHLDVPAVEVLSTVVLACDGIAGALCEYHFAISPESGEPRSLLRMMFEMHQQGAVQLHDV